MGHGMATNIRRKISRDSELIVYDISTEAMTQFVNENPGMKIRAASCPREIAETAVS